MTARRWVAAFCCLLLVACGAAEPRWAPDEALAKHSYRPETGPELRLFTVVSTRNGSGAHSGLLITTARERILFDPAGTFSLPTVPERNDVHYAITPHALEFYLDYHARETYDVIEQRLSVTPSQAEHVAALAKAYGAVPKTHCSLAINRVLKAVPGFEAMQVTYFPNVTREQFGALAGVRMRKISDDDPDRNDDVLKLANGG